MIHKRSFVHWGLIVLLVLWATSTAPAQSEKPGFGTVMLAEPDLKPIAETQKRAAAGDSEAQYQMGFRAEWGRELPPDNLQALKWYRKAAEQGHAQAQVR